MSMSAHVPADDPGHDRAPARLAWAGNGRPFGQRIRVPKTAELVAAELRRKIVRGELAEGDALPSEAALMAEFAVSRPRCGRPSGCLSRSR
jgi:Bacterial regulatory proteins, gntR family